MSLHIHDGENVGRPSRKSAGLKRQLLAELSAGRLKPGAILPSQERLAERFGVSRPTVRRTLAEMEQDGLVRRAERRGTFVSEDARQRLHNGPGSLALLISGARDLEAFPLIRGFERGCRGVDQAMTLSDSENDFYKQGEAILRLSQMDIAGLAILPATGRPTPSYHITALHERGIPVVFLHRGAENIRAPLLAVPHEEEGRLVGGAFAEHGHRRVAMIIGYRAEQLRDAWARGIRQSLRTVGGELPDEFIYSLQTTSLDFEEHEGQLLKTLKRMLNAERPPTAIYAVTDDFAQVAYLVLRRLDVRVPEDISLVGLGDVCRKGSLGQQLTSVVIDGTGIGRQAVELLRQMQSGQRPLDDDERIEVPITLSCGRTLGSAPEERRNVSRKQR